MTNPTLSRPLQSLQQQITALAGTMAPVDLMERLRQLPEIGQGSLCEQLGALLGLPTPSAQELFSLAPRFDMLAFPECARLRCAVLQPGLANGPSCFIVTNPFDHDLVAWARTCFGALQVALVSAETLDAYLAKCERSLSAMSTVGTGAAHDEGTHEQAEGTEVLSLALINHGDSPAVRMVNSTLFDALRSGASDVHLETDNTGLMVKFRMDGVLTSIQRIDDLALATQTVSRIKVMSQLDISERRVPQDGRLQVSFEGRMIDVRVSVMPSIHGEDVVLRVLDRHHLAESLAGLTLERLGFDIETACALQALCRKPHGMVLVTGPTGSGKTTTLYAAIAQTHEARDKFITIEDPVEYQLPGVLQIPVNERKGLTFARGLRSILRHDPDKLLVGEIRDAETAQIAVQAALTGHLVFTTVHANTVFDVVGRFRQFGVDAYTFASAINGVLAQRLVRRLCPRCAVPANENASARLAELGAEWAEGAALATRLLSPVGCESCRGTGYSGRLALGELLTLTPNIKAMLANQTSLATIQAEAASSGWKSMRERALAAAAVGLTSMEEVERVAV